MTSHKIGRTAVGLVLASALSICAAAATTRTASADDIISTVGLTVVTAPAVVTSDFIINSGGTLPNQLIFAEQQGRYVACPAGH